MTINCPSASVASPSPYKLAINLNTPRKIQEYTEKYEEDFILGCIDSLLHFDPSQREKKHYQTIIQNSFSKLLSRNSKVVQKYFLHNQLGEMAMNFEVLDLDDPSIVKYRYVEPRR